MVQVGTICYRNADGEFIATRPIMREDKTVDDMNFSSVICEGAEHFLQAAMRELRAERRTRK